MVAWHRQTKLQTAISLDRNGCDALGRPTTNPSGTAIAALSYESFNQITCFQQASTVFLYTAILFIQPHIRYTVVSVYLVPGRNPFVWRGICSTENAYTQIPFFVKYIGRLSSAA